MLHERGTPRPLFLVGAGVATAAVAVLAAFADLGALYPVTILAGLAFGVQSGVTPHFGSRGQVQNPTLCHSSSLTCLSVCSSMHRPPCKPASAAPACMSLRGHLTTHGTIMFTVRQGADLR